MDIWALTEPIAEELGLEVLDIELKGGAGGRIVRIYLDSREGGGGVGIADCAAVSRRLTDVLDAHDPVAGGYMLEVSSPGVNRPLRKPEHYQRAVGERVRVRFRDAEKGRRTMIGTLEAVDGGGLRVAGDDGVAELVELDSIEKANVEFVFDEPGKPGKTKGSGKSSGKSSGKKHARRKRH